VQGKVNAIGLPAAIIAAAALSTAACGSSAPRAAPAAETSASSPALISDQQAQAALNGLIGAKADDGTTVTAVSVVPGSEVDTKSGGYTVKADVTYSDGSVYRETATAGPGGSVSTNADYQEKSPTTPSASPSPSPAAPTTTKQIDVVVFKVWGSGEPSIQYGTDSSTSNPSDGAGPLGDGNYLPWQASMPYNPGALYYAVSAQLEGSGSIQDSVTEVVTTWCSGSKPKTESFPLASGNASGGYGIATAEYAGGNTGNAQQAESDAGC
jgi:hypothetical protein